MTDTCTDHVCSDVHCLNYGFPHHCGSACITDFATETEARLMRKWHDEQCGCAAWPKTCLAYPKGWRSIAPHTFDVSDVLIAFREAVDASRA